jgi:hypothetical protein
MLVKYSVAALQSLVGTSGASVDNNGGSVPVSESKVDGALPRAAANRGDAGTSCAFTDEGVPATGGATIGAAAPARRSATQLLSQLTFERLCELLHAYPPRLPAAFVEPLAIFAASLKGK